MDEHKRNILIIAATTAAIILLAGVNIAHILATSTPRTSEAEETTSTAAIGGTGAPAPQKETVHGTGTSAPKRKTAVEHQKPLEVCERLAPKAAAAYTSKGEDRDRLVKRYFTADAQGLNIPTDRIAEQPDVQASGGMNAGTDTTATCSVWTGLESPWTLTYQWTADKGWKCTGISGPLEGAYTTLGDKTPDEKGEGEE